MAKILLKAGGAGILLLLVAGCAGTSAISGPVARTHCGLVSHDVANLNAVDPRRAYWCKPDMAGYLGEDRPGSVRP
jgi:hypothetical protein